MSLFVETIVTGPFKENSYFFWYNNSRDAILIDPGDDYNLICNQLDKKKLMPVAIINTHAHLDHIGAVSELKQIYDIPFYLHEDEALILDTYKDTCDFFGVEQREKPEVDIWLKDDREILINNFKINLFHTPGHTPGGICIKVDNHLFVGDTIFHGSVGRTDLPGGSWEKLESSLINLVKSMDPDIILHSGHGPETTLANEIEKNPFLIALNDKLNL